MINEIMKLFNICLKSPTFQWRSYIYIYKELVGTPMGSPMSVVISELTMQIFENKALINPPSHPLFWTRYSDDIISALPSEEIVNSQTN